LNHYRLSKFFQKNVMAMIFGRHGPEAEACLTVVRFWRKADIEPAPALYCLSAYDPKRTSAVHCGNGF
jgi:hypothetical protein